MDRLARKGVVPKNHYLTLASLMTGHYPIRTVLSRGYLHSVEEFGLSLDETLLPELDNLGHWNYTTVKEGFDTFFPVEDIRKYTSHSIKDSRRT